MLQAVSERLVARGHLVSVFAVNGATQGEVISVSGGSLAPRETINGVLVRRFPPEDRATRLMRGLTDLPGGWRSARSVLGDGVGAVRRRPGPLPFLPQLLRAEVDVVTTVNWVWAPAYAGHLARRFRRFRLIGVPILHIARPWADSTTFRPMLAQCDLVLASTTADADFMRERGARHTVVTGMGVDPAAYTSPDGSALRARFPLGDGPVVGFVGRQDRHKGAVTLLEAMAVVWERFPEARLLLAGQSAHRSDEMRQALEALPDQARVRVHLLDDFADAEAPGIVAACDVVTVPSVEEGFGLVYLEAWMAGKPVIGARIPSTRCVIAEGVDGLLAEPLDAADLARCLLDLLRDPARRERMGAAGREKTLANFTWDAVTDRWEAALQGSV
jgi:glycosyltransferase involved in cell wall biosynthesis